MITIRRCSAGFGPVLAGSLRTARLLGTLGALLTPASLLTVALLPTPLEAQEIRFAEGLPRTLVFIQEDGGAGVASRELTGFLAEAGFPVVDPALAAQAAQAERVRAALAGDEIAATELGRDFGAQLLLLGVADWGTRPDPVDGSLVTGTSELSLRALRLDHGDEVARAVADARVIEATDQAARTRAIRDAAGKLLSGPMLGRILNDWDARAWQERGYWRPEPGSIEERTGSAGSGVGAPPGGAAGGPGAPGVAILRADVLPDPGEATRGIGVVKKGSRDRSDVRNLVRLEGLVVGDATRVEVDGAPALLEPLSEGEGERFGLPAGEATRFRREFSLPISQDTVRVVVGGPSGVQVEALAAPRIDKRWAVVIGVGDYASDDIPDLRFAHADAEAVAEFLRSDAAGPFDEVLFLSGAEATGAAMRQALFVFLQDADWDDLVVIYFAGHGAPDPSRPENLYLLPADADPAALAATGFPMWDVKTALRRQIASERVVVIADACHSAGTTEGFGSGAEGGNAIAGGFQQLFSPSRRLMMTAAASNEFSLEDERWGGHGVFTHFLMEALRGKGDGDGDGIVTFSEAFDHVSREVRTATGGRQNPQKAGLGDVPLAVVGGGGASGGGGAAGTGGGRE